MLKVSNIKFSLYCPYCLSLLPLPFLSCDETLLIPVQSTECQLRPGHDVGLEMKPSEVSPFSPRPLSHLGNFSIIIFVKTLEEEVRSLHYLEEVLLGEEPVLLRS